MLSPNEKELRALEEIRPSRDRVDERVFEENNEEVVDDNVRNLIIRLSSSTARGAFLANRLADIHRRIATGPSLSGNNENWFSNQAEEDEDTETDLVPRDEEDEDELTVPSPEIQSEIEEVSGFENDEEDNDIATPITSEEGEMSRPASVDSLVLAIDEAINILDPVNSHPQLSSFLSVTSDGPPVTAEVRPSFLAEDDDDEDDDDADLIAAVSDLPQAGLAPASSETSGGSSSSSAPDSSTAVTRYLIKHLPKQLTQLRYKQSFCQSKVYISSSFLRNQKHELEDKIHDLEQVVSEQRTQMAEYERRAEVEKSRAKKLEDSLHQVGAVARIYEA